MKTYLFYFIILGLLIFNSCSKDVFIEIEEENSQKELIVKDGYLHFADWQEFNLNLDKLNNLQPSEFKTLEHDLGFSSFYSNYKNFELEYNERMQQADIMLSADIHIQAMNDAAAKYPTAIVAEFPDGGVYMKANIYDAFFSRIVNSNGLIAIGKYLYKFDDEKHEAILNLENPNLKVKAPGGDPDPGSDDDEYPGGGGGGSMPDIRWERADEFFDGTVIMKRLTLKMYCYSEGRLHYYAASHKTNNGGITWNNNPVYFNATTGFVGQYGQTISSGITHLNEEYTISWDEYMTNGYEPPVSAYFKMIDVLEIGVGYIFRNKTINF